MRFTVLFAFLAWLPFARAEVPCLMLASTPEESLAKLQCLDEALPKYSAYRHFNHMYMTMTKNVIAAINEGRFEDSGTVRSFVSRFADYYFVAVEHHLAGRFDQISGGWRELSLMERQGRSPRRVKGAMAGMLVHIGRDLPMTLSDLNFGHVSLAGPEAFRRDYLKINGLVGSTFSELRAEFFKPRCASELTPLQALADDVRYAAVVPTIAALREKAWIDGRIYYALRDTEIRHGLYRLALDHSADVAVRAVTRVQGR